VTTSRIESIKKDIASLSSKELAAFQKWFYEFDAAQWDRQIERDAESGKLDKLWMAEAERRLEELESGQATAVPADHVFAKLRKKRP
jgi:putative addiction module component (TIGR02574 family)